MSECKHVWSDRGSHVVCIHCDHKMEVVEETFGASPVKEEGQPVAFDKHYDRLQERVEKMPWYGRLVWRCLPRYFRTSLHETLNAAQYALDKDLEARRVEGWIPTTEMDGDPFMTVVHMASARGVTALVVDHDMGDPRMTAVGDKALLSKAAFVATLGYMGGDEEMEFDCIDERGVLSMYDQLQKERGTRVGALMFVIDHLHRGDSSKDGLMRDLREACAWRGMRAYFDIAADAMDRAEWVRTENREYRAEMADALLAAKPVGKTKFVRIEKALARSVAVYLDPTKRGKS